MRTSVRFQPIELSRFSSMTPANTVRSGSNEKPEIGALVFRCPIWGVEIESGIETDLNTLQNILRLPLTVRCASCSQDHEFIADDGRLASTARRPLPRGATLHQVSGGRTAMELVSELRGSLDLRPDVSTEERLSQSMTKHILKLRWIGKGAEADRLEHALLGVTPGHALYQPGSEHWTGCYPHRR